MTARMDEQVFAGFESSAAGTTAPAGSGRTVVARVPMLRGHAGRSPDLVLKWTNVDPSTAAVDVVVHFHGYSGRGAQMDLVEKERISGLDFADPATGVPGRRLPTVGIIPRGNHANSMRNPAAYTFPALTTRHGLQTLVQHSLGHLRTLLGAPNLRCGRLILTAHSGGGAAVEAALAFNDPDEVHIFDGVYGPSPRITSWATSRIACDQSRCGKAPGALRVLYIPGTRTERFSVAVGRAVAAQLRARPQASGGIAPRYRVEAVRARGVGHNQVPRAYGWRLLAGPGSDLPLTARAAAPPTARAAAPPTARATAPPAPGAAGPAASAQSGAGFTPSPVECPGGGRIADKRAPDRSEVVDVPAYGRRTVPLHRPAADALLAMIGAARADGIRVPLLLPVSGFRPPEQQVRLWRQALAKYGSPQEARKWVAPPGSSAHQSGRAVDLYLGSSISSRHVETMRRSAPYRWLVANAQRFGFYPYTREPWHWEFNPPNSRCLQ